MNTGRLLLLLLILAVVAVVVLWFVRRRSTQQDGHRVEAAALRGRAEELGATVTGQQVFAEQADERAAVARAEAEERAREAARLEEEAAQQRAAADEARREYEATMRRADDIDPDVKESSFPPVHDEEPVADASPAAVTDQAPPTTAPTDEGSTWRGWSDEGAPATRAERREAREQAEAEGSWASPAAPVAGAAGAAAVGASTWGERDDADGTSQRVASAADYRDDVDARSAGSSDVSEAPAEGTTAGMGDETREQDQTTTDLSHDAESPSGEWGGPPANDADVTAERDDDPARTAGTAAAALGTGAAGAAAATSAAEEDAAHDEAVRQGAVGGDATGEDRPTSTEDRTSTDVDAGDGATIIGDIEEYASTEPVLVEDQAPPVQPDDDGSDTTATALAAAETDRADDSGADSGADVGADSGAAVGADSGADAGADAGAAAAAGTGAGSSASDDETLGDEAHATAESGGEVAASAEDTPAEGGDRFDPTPQRDWAADEGELLAENRERGERLEDERTDLGSDTAAGAAGAPTATTDEFGSAAGTGGGAGTASDTGSSSGTGDPGTSDAPEQSASGTEDLPTGTDEGPGERAARRISEFHELRDGGYGVGSAATLDDGAQPMDHAVQGFRDSMTFRSPGDPGYDDGQPDVWFYDEDAAERSGFRREG